MNKVTSLSQMINRLKKKEMTARPNLDTQSMFVTAVVIPAGEYISIFTSTSTPVFAG